MGWAKGANRNISNSNAQPPLYSSLKLSRFKMESLREGITESQAAACGEGMESRLLCQARRPYQVTHLNHLGIHKVYKMITIPTLHHKDIYYMYKK